MTTATPISVDSQYIAITGGRYRSFALSIGELQQARSLCHMGFSVVLWGYHSWMVYFTENPKRKIDKMDEHWGYPHLGNLHRELYPYRRLVIPKYDQGPGLR